MIVAFTPDRNARANDAAGAFWPGAAGLVATFGRDVVREVRVDVSAPAAAQRAAQLRALDGAKELEGVAWFCHGLPDGLCLGWRTVGPDWEQLVRALDRVVRPASSSVRRIALAGAAPIADPSRTVALFACSTGSKPHGFASSLSAAVPFLRALCHGCAGHSWCNRDKRWAEGGKLSPVVEGWTAPAVKAWSSRMASQHGRGHVALRAPWLHADELRAEMEAA